MAKIKFFTLIFFFILTKNSFACDESQSALVLDGQYKFTTHLYSCKDHVEKCVKINLYEKTKEKEFSLLKTFKPSFEDLSRCFYKLETAPFSGNLRIIDTSFWPKADYVLAVPEIVTSYDKKFRADLIESKKSFSSLNNFMNTYAKKAMSRKNTKILHNALNTLFEKADKSSTKELEMVYQMSWKIKNPDIRSKSLALIFKNIEQSDTPKQYSWYTKKFTDTQYTEKANKRAFNLISQKNNINDYEWFIENFDSEELENKAISSIYKIVEKKENIAGFKWFIERYKKNKHSREALKRIHELAFKAAKEIDTIDAYNDFIVTYPISAQLSQAQDIAYELDKEEYSSFFTSDDKLSRSLSIKAKQMKRRVSETGNKNYLLVFSRMTRLLETEFSSEVSTEKHLENEEILNALNDVKDQLIEIKKINQSILDGTKDIYTALNRQTSTMDAHFRKNAESKAMADKYIQDHMFWERYIKNN